MRERISLSGIWQFSLPEGKQEYRRVPASYPCVGSSVYELRLPGCIYPAEDERIFLCFEGIAYEAALSVNGYKLGEMLPYSYYSYDITSCLTNAGENIVRLELEDITAVFGPAEGWKSYGGIIRGVYLEKRSSCHVEDVFFHALVSEDFRQALCTNEVTISGLREGIEINAELSRGGITTAQCGILATEDINFLRFNISNPELWSPDFPNLYTLTVSLTANGIIIDEYSLQVGFKRFEMKNQRFYLNGEPLFLAGVCRHDMQTDEDGFTQTTEQIEKDMAMIKAMGANFVRLVHYPHDRRVIEAADRLGLLVSGEPGLWWSDLDNEAITSRALTVLEKMIIRDRNNISVAFWLAFNECVFTREFLRDAAAVSRKADPTRLISGANCMDIHLTKRLYDELDIDFYTFHPYGSRPDNVTGGHEAPSSSLNEVCTVLSGKPLIFTEWGGYYVDNNPALFDAFCDEMFRLANNKEPGPCLAGMFYWSWQDIYECNRGVPGCRDGILQEGLVSIDRVPKVNFDTFHQALTRFRHPLKLQPEVRIQGAGSPGGSYTPLLLDSLRSKEQESLFTQALQRSETMDGMFFKKKRQITFGPVLPFAISRLGSLKVNLPAGAPLAINTTSGTVKFFVPENTAKQVKALWFIGQCSLEGGWPAVGKFGEELGSYIIDSVCGDTLAFPLRNGIETATVFSLWGPSQIEPRASRSEAAFTLAYDKNWEVYKTGLIRFELPAYCDIGKISIEITNSAYTLLLYGITLEH